LRIAAIFEQWYIGDGTYPPFRKNQLVNLAFEMYPERLTVDEGRAATLKHAGNAEYEFSGTVLRHYCEHKPHVLLIEADGFRFYVSNGATPFDHLQRGERVSGRGALTLDHYLWAEFGHKYDCDPPNLFYTLRVARITEVEIPTTHIGRSETGWAAPTWVSAREVQNSREVDSMDERKWDVGFFVVEYDDEGVGEQVVPRTAT
jgi:hypothetical protein